MAGDDHPNKKVVAAGESSKDKGKAVAVEEGKISEPNEEETPENLPAPLPQPGTETSIPAPGGSTIVISMEVPPVKKSRTVNAGSSTVAAVPPPPPPPPVAAPQLQVPCPLCHRIFDSYPAMFGHQRVHKERTYRGAYPPPTFQREGSPPHTAEETEEAARHAAQMLIDMSKGRFEKPNAVISVHEAGEGSSSSAARGFAVDLNIPLDVDKAADEEDEQREKEKVQLDLNKSPPGSE